MTMNHVFNVNDMLFARGFALYPRHADVSALVWNDLETWPTKEINGYILRHHPQASVFSSVHQTGAVVLVGNAVNPFTGELEQDIVNHILANEVGMLEDGRLRTELIDYVDQLTGRFRLMFIEGDTVCALCDATALSSLYFFQQDDSIYLSSHSQLLAEMVGSERDSEVQEIIDSGFYSVGRKHLPGYKSPFKGIELLGANVYISSLLKKRVRIFPREPLDKDSRTFTEVVLESADILKKTAELYVASRPVRVSLSLGQDSRISLSAFHDWRQQIEAYSYCGNQVETVEANKVHEFAKLIGVKHHVIDTENVPLEEANELAGVLDRTSAYLRKHKTTEFKKLVALLRWFPQDALEVKGEASEVGRATYTKRSGIKNFPELDARAMSNLYKKAFYPRHLLKRVDGYFEEFKRKGEFGFSSLGYDDYDLFFWEHRTACCASLGMQDHDIYHDATAIMNNRILMNNFLTPSFEDRLQDKMHLAVCEKLWPGVLATPTSQRTSAKGRVKVLVENVFFRVNRF